MAPPAHASAAAGPAGHLRLALQLDLQLRRSGPQSAWSAELRTPDATEALHFASLPELISFIARLDTPPAGGLR